jgi:hypothetical protein
MALCEELISSALAKIDQDWTCTPVDGGWMLVTTSYQYSDGDYVEVLVRSVDESIQITDGGEALARLDLAGVNIESGRAREMWRRLLRAHELELNHGRLIAQVAVDAAGQTIDDMANAMANLDGIRILVPASRSPKFAERLVIFFQGEFEHVEEGPQLRGKSGGLYKATAAVGGPEQPIIVQAVAGTNTQMRQRSMEHAFTMFSDINGSVPLRQKLVVLSADDWKPEQERLLSGIAFVGSWAHRNRIVSFVTSEELPDSHLLMPAQTEFR